MLHRLVGAMKPRGFISHVVSLRSAGPLASDLRALGTDVDELGIDGHLPTAGDVARLRRFLRRAAPDLVQTWMYHADLLGGLATRSALPVPIVWGLHNSTLDPVTTKRTTRWTARINALASHWLPAAIVSCSRASVAVHRRLGYAVRKMVVIPNGFDLEGFRPDAKARIAVRNELGLLPTHRLVGHFARFHPQKDHHSLCRAAAVIAANRADTHFLLAGKEIEPSNPVLGKWIAETGFPERFHLIGERRDIPRLTASLDLAVMSSSYGEAFPLVLGEAMACAVPCVATDVGDAAEMISGSGTVVRPKDPPALAQAVCDLLALNASQRERLGAEARARIQRSLSIAATAERYQQLYQSLLQPTE